MPYVIETHDLTKINLSNCVVCHCVANVELLCNKTSLYNWGIENISNDDIDGLVQDCSNSSALAMM